MFSFGSRVTSVVPLSLAVLSASFSLLSTTAEAQSTPGPLPGGDNLELRDPSIIYNPDSQSYFLFSTGSNFSIYTSKSLEGPWDHQGSVLPNCSIIQVADHCQNTWAPDISFLNNKYILYYALSEPSASVIGVATSDTMEPGNWTDLGEVVRSTENDSYNAIDPNIIQVDGGELVFTYGSWRDGIVHMNMTNITTPINTTIQHVAGGDNHPSEGAFTFHKNGFYYLFYSYGITGPLNATNLPPPGREYKVLVGRSVSPNGPFLDKSNKSLTDIGQDVTDQPGTLVLASHDNVYAPGGQSVYEDSEGTGRDVMVYHYVRKDRLNETTAAVLGINYLDFSSGWPVVSS